MDEQTKKADEMLVEAARKQLRQESSLRWGVLGAGGLFLGMCAFAFFRIFKQLDQLGHEQVTAGFLAGFTLSFTCATFGVLGGLCLAKFIQGLAVDTQRSRLLVHYHDRLQDLVGRENM